MFNSDVEMRRECNLELCLLPAGFDARPPPSPVVASDSVESRNEEVTRNSQQLTIFYNGRICVCDVTELQARAIIQVAKREIDEKLKIHNAEEIDERLRIHKAGAVSPSQPTAFSMKKSLQHFLQKRKSRIQATSPY